MRRKTWGLALGAAVASLAMPGAAFAAAGDPCDNLTDEDNGIPTIYIENGDTQEPLVKKLGALLIQSGSPLRIVYRNRPTCTSATRSSTERG